MIYTVTFNPSLDYVMDIENFKQGSVNRSEKEQIFVGGKGINVSMVLKNLGNDSNALGFIAGFTGKQIEDQLKEIGCQSDFIKLDKGLSRINVKLRGTIESEINGAGPEISNEDIEKLYKKINEIKEGDILVLAGSIPSSLPSNIYENILEMLQEKNIKVVVDATKDLLLNVLKYNPFLIKPNNHELAEMFKVEINTSEDIIKYAKKLQDLGARNVLISMAGDGAILVGENGQIIQSKAPKGIVKNSVGAGDSMVAGFIHGYIENSQELTKAFKMAVATGSASAFSDKLATKEEAYNLYKTL